MGQVQVNEPVTFHADVESPSGNGLRSVVSEPIDSLTADEFWALLAADLRGRLFAHPDGAQAPGLGAPRAGAGEGLLVAEGERLYEWFICPELDEAECYCYGVDPSLSRLASRGTLRAYRNPFRLEFWNLVYGQPESGEKLKGVMTKILRTMRSTADCSLNVDSPGCSGLKCVLSDPIMDSVLSPETFWGQTKEVIKRKALRVLPDGGIIQKAAAGWELFSASQEAYTKHVFNDALREIVSYTYRDLELSDKTLETVRHLRIHARPYRLEMWLASADRRQAGEEEKLEVLKLLGPVFEQAQLLTARPNDAADTDELEDLYAQVSAFRKEMSIALDALHEGAASLAW